MSEARVEVTLTADISKFVAIAASGRYVGDVHDAGEHPRRGSPVSRGRAWRSMEKAAKSAHRLSLAFMSKRTKRRHLRRCYLCSPMAHPKPLCIDGHEYRRRRKHR